MRILLGLVTVLLILIALAGLGFGAWVLYLAIVAANGGAAAVFTALAVGAIPFVVGTVALGAVAIVLTVDESRLQTTALLEQQIVMLRELQPDPPPLDPAVAGRATGSA